VNLRSLAVAVLCAAALLPAHAAAQDATPVAATPAASFPGAFMLIPEPDEIGDGWSWRSAAEGPEDLLARKEGAVSFAGIAHASYAGPVAERATIEVLVAQDDIAAIVDVWAGAFRRYQAIADPWFEAGEEGWGEYDASGSSCRTLRLAWVPQLDIDDAGAAFGLCVVDQRTAVIVTVSGTPAPGDERDRLIDLVDLIMERAGVE
jgi:hypothetical protein